MGAATREVRAMMQALSHPAVVNCLGIFSDSIKRQVGIVMDYCDGGSLGRYIGERSEIRSSLLADWRNGTLSRLLMEAASGLQYLHSWNMLHGDIKPENVMIKDGHACLGDLGLARLLDATHSTRSQSAGLTPAYSSPEALNPEGLATVMRDVYSFGMTIYAMVAGIGPWAGYNMITLAGALYRGERPLFANPVPEGCPPDLIQLMRECWQQEPDRRPTMDAVSSRLALMNPVRVFDEISRWRTGGQFDLVWQREPSQPQLWTAELPRGSELFRRFETEFMKGGPFSARLNPKKIRVERIVVFDNEILHDTFVSICDKMDRRGGSDFFRKAVQHEKEGAGSTPEKTAAYKELDSASLYRGTNNGLNVLRVFHGPSSPRLLTSIAALGLANQRLRDGGYFGAGVNTTTETLYALEYATGEIDGVPVPPNDDGNPFLTFTPLRPNVCHQATMLCSGVWRCFPAATSSPARPTTTIQQTSAVSLVSTNSTRAKNLPTPTRTECERTSH